jgi:PAS domain S-box-containing protein
MGRGQTSPQWFELSFAKRSAARDNSVMHTDVPLEAPAETFRLLVDSVKDYAIFMLDATGHVLTWNRGAERIKGYAAAEILGKHFSRFYTEDDVRAGKCEHELEIAARDGRFEEEGWRVRKDGSEFWASVVITAVRGGDGTLLGFAKVTRDLS